MERNIRQLACAVMLQATRDYVRGTKAERDSILKDLRSPWMDHLTQGTSNIVAERLENNIGSISRRLRKYDKEEKK